MICLRKSYMYMYVDYQKMDDNDACQISPNIFRNPGAYFDAFEDLGLCMRASVNK